MSKAVYSRDYETKLMDYLTEYGIDYEFIVKEFLSYFSSDETCAALESICDDCDLAYPDAE